MKCQHMTYLMIQNLYHQLIQIIENGTSANRQGGREILGDPALLLPRYHKYKQIHHFSMLQCNPAEQVVHGYPKRSLLKVYKTL